MKPFHALLGAASGTHAADQLALATLPLTATLVFGAGPGLVGLMVAVQSAAWLLVSLPAGAWVDRMRRHRLLKIALGCALAASVAAVGAAILNEPIALAAAAFGGAAGTVIYTLTAVSLLPVLVPASDLPRANARLELARACMSLAAPVVAGLLAQHLSPTWGYGLAALGAALALTCVTTLPKTEAASVPADRASFAASIEAGARFVLRHELLRGIGLCAIFWNFGFFGLLAIWAPLALGPFELSPAEVGLALSAVGAGQILGALSAPYATRALPPLVTLIFGPAVSLAGILLIVRAPALSFFLIGFGPMLWLICQTTLRQLVTPTHLMGRVNATIQTAIYGVRPLGALAAGTLAAWAGVEAALGLVALSFALSTLVIVFSPLARLRRMPLQREGTFAGIGPA
jgi:MFS family permease